MSDERMAVDIRSAFDDGYEPNAGLEERVVAAIPWEEPMRRHISWPRLGGAVAGAVAIALIGVLVAPNLLSHLNVPFPGTTEPANPPAYSLAAVTSDSVFVVQRDPMTPTEILLQSRDGGRTWTERLRFTSIYDGMQMFGRDGFVWGIDLAGRNCGSLDSSCHPQMPTFELDLFRTTDGGASWTMLPANRIPTDGVFFLDSEHGWIVAGSPASGLNGEVLYGTTDGGKTWNRIGDLPAAPMGWVYGVGNYRVTFSSAEHGWYLGNNEIFATVDGGRSWSQVTDLYNVPGTITAYSQPTFNSEEGVLPVAYRAAGGPDNATANVIAFIDSQDGGATWSLTPHTAPAGFAPVGDDVSISILDIQHIWLTSQSLSGGDNVQAAPAIARTADGGLTWTVTHHTPRILQMIFRDATHGYALDVTGQQDVNGILSTSDAGATWQRVNVPLFA